MKRKIDDYITKKEKDHESEDYIKTLTFKTLKDNVDGKHIKTPIKADSTPMTKEINVALEQTPKYSTRTVEIKKKSNEEEE